MRGTEDSRDNKCFGQFNASAKHTESRGQFETQEKLGETIQLGGCGCEQAVKQHSSSGRTVRTGIELWASSINQQSKSLGTIANQEFGSLNSGLCRLV